MIKTTLEQIIDSYDNFGGLLSLKLPTKVAYWVNRIYNKVTPMVDDFKNKQNELIRKHGELKIDPKAGRNVYEVKEGEKKTEYMAEVKKLVSTVVELPFNVIPLSALEKMPVEPKYLIEYIFEEDK